MAELRQGVCDLNHPFGVVNPGSSVRKHGFHRATFVEFPSRKFCHMMGLSLFYSIGKVWGQFPD